MGGAQRAAIGTLAVILPGVVDAHAAVGAQFGGGVGDVFAVAAGAENAQRDADALLDLGRGVLSGALFGRVVVGLDHVEELLERVDLVLLAPRVGGAGLGQVLVAHLERVHAHLAGKLVDDALAGEERLRRAPGAERGAPGVVGAHQLAVAAHVGDVVAAAAEQAFLHQVVAELHVRPVVAEPVVLHGQELAVLVGGELAVIVVRRALAGVGDRHPVVVLEVHDAAGSHVRGPYQRFEGGAELVAERTAGVVLDHAQVLELDAETLVDHGGVKVQGDAL